MDKPSALIPRMVHQCLAHRLQQIQLFYFTYFEFQSSLRLTFTFTTDAAANSQSSSSSTILSNEFATSTAFSASYPAYIQKARQIQLYIYPPFTRKTISRNSKEKTLLLSH
ncbi:hypothetical protein FRX31_008890 [Thalictrum thalictroides]|uniref:Uncharacterized protein n=1 Tax=Thalictrum thalictroides TaxID=46969 RepID=A0A7J6WWV7_THATH|nr:hypothetical protein FRX31_008890 [Thalictrum thalictroides]